MNSQQLIDELLAGTDQDIRSAHKAHLTRHIKELLTQLSKSQLENNVAIKKNTATCQLRCYNKQSFDTFESDVLAKCTQGCNQLLEDVNKFLDNINYLSQRKFTKCSSSCHNMTNLANRELCLWDCYNRLDKRYVKYWYGQKQQIIGRYDMAE